MTLILLSAATVIIAFGIAFLWVLRTLVSSPPEAASRTDWENLFAPTRYKPMERLLDPVDAEFLSSHPSYSRRMARRFRAGRVVLFRGYARCLGRDFNKVAGALKMIMVHAPVDRSSLAGLLLKQQLLFGFTMATLEMKLALHRVGIGVPEVDVRNLIGALDTLRMQLRALSAIAQPAAAAAAA
jgi:hypothetical protein